MNHRKIRSHECIPFSWEEKPGIPKYINHHKSSSDMLPHENVNDVDSNKAEFMNIAPPPPCRPRKGFRWRDDPFLAALKSCSTLGDEKNMSKSSSSFLWCKQSCNVANGNLVKFSNLLPPIPKQRYSCATAKSSVTVRNSN